MESLYVVLFSNGHIKVGRSIDPTARIASHAERVSCMGVEMVARHFALCEDRAELREAELIAACTEAPGSRRFKSEWFAGLDYDAVCRWANEWACRDLGPEVTKETRWSGVISDLRKAGWTHTALARECGCGATTISRLALAQQDEPMYSVGEKLLQLQAKASA